MPIWANDPIGCAVSQSVSPLHTPISILATIPRSSLQLDDSATTSPCHKIIQQRKRNLTRNETPTIPTQLAVAWLDMVTVPGGYIYFTAKNGIPHCYSNSDQFGPKNTDKSSS